MALIPWPDQNGTSVVDQNGLDIQFKRTSAKINAEFDISATVKLITPMNAEIAASFDISPTATIKVYMAASIRSVWTINPQGQEGISKWPTIMFRYIGDRII